MATGITTNVKLDIISAQVKYVNEIEHYVTITILKYKSGI